MIFDVILKILYSFLLFLFFSLGNLVSFFLMVGLIIFGLVNWFWRWFYICCNLWFGFEVLVFLIFFVWVVDEVFFSYWINRFIFFIGVRLSFFIVFLIEVFYEKKFFGLLLKMCIFEIKFFLVKILVNFEYVFMLVSLVWGVFWIEFCIVYIICLDIVCRGNKIRCWFYCVIRLFLG